MSGYMSCPRCRMPFGRIIRAKDVNRRTYYYGFCEACGRNTGDKPRSLYLLARLDWEKHRKGDDRYGRRPPF